MRGFLLGKFMPPHAGHVAMIDAARSMVDELTILVAWLPGDPIPGEKRLAWMKEMFPHCRVVGHGGPAPQEPDESAHFWPIWRSIVAKAHPEPIDYLFAGERYGEELACQVGGLFVPLGGRILGADGDGLGGLSGRAVREAPWAHWRYLPAPVRNEYALTVCLHGVECVGKSTLAERLASHYGTLLVPEYGRTHCELYGTDCREKDLLLIGKAQQAMIDAARPWCDRRLIVDTDSLMTAAWAEMMIGHVPPALMQQAKADLYILLEPDVPFVDDGTRVYGDPVQRSRFDDISRRMLAESGVNVVTINGSWEERFEAACAAIDSFQRD